MNMALSNSVELLYHGTHVSTSSRPYHAHKTEIFPVHLHEWSIHFLPIFCHVVEGRSKVVLDDVGVEIIPFKDLIAPCAHAELQHQHAHICVRTSRSCSNAHKAHRVMRITCIAAVIEIAGDLGCNNSRAPLLVWLLSRANANPSVSRGRCLAIDPKPAHRSMQTESPGASPSNGTTLHVTPIQCLNHSSLPLKGETSQMKERDLPAKLSAERLPAESPMWSKRDVMGLSGVSCQLGTKPKKGRMQEMPDKSGISRYLGKFVR